ncbi:hypothetical protein JY460_21720, partial [Stenotrophomonas maltophilia]|nr:hypothetical protein [Stenotrophomonas maltophilia]
MRGWNPIEIEYFETSSKRIHAWRGSTVSTKVDTHQQQRADQRSAPTNSRGKLSKAGWVRLRGREPHGPEACL